MDKIVKKCGYNNCNMAAIKRGYCDKHYHGAIKNGLIITNPRMNVAGSPSKHPLYKCWASMKNRCYNKKDIKNYEWYGARGIKVCDRWTGKNGFWNFVKDMGDRPKGYSLDRIDNNKDYSPDNCKWSSPKEQAYNRRTAIDICINGVKLTTEDAANILKLHPETIRRRWREGGENWTEVQKELTEVLR